MTGRAGSDLEKWLLRELESIFSKYDPVTKSQVRKTINSGATIGDNDVVLTNIAGKDWQFECKSTGRSRNFNIREDDWKHLEVQASSRLREAIMITSNRNGKILATMDIQLLLSMLLSLQNKVHLP